MNKFGRDIMGWASHATMAVFEYGAPPKDADIDWSHENMSTEAYIRHRAILKGGKMVSW